MGFVHHHQGVFVEFGSQVRTGGVRPACIMKLTVARQLVVRHHLDETTDIVRCEKAVPGWPKGGRTQEQGALPVLRAGLEDRPAYEGFAKPDLVRDDDPAKILEDAPGAPHAM